jgi:hypothetical protein
MNIELARLLKNICEDVGNQECEIREDYSGRGMYGKTTAGIVIDSVPLLVADILQWVSGNIGKHQTVSEGDTNAGIDEWLGGEIPDVSDLRVDNMGNQTILY